MYKVNVSKCGKNDKGIWVYGTADLGGLNITSIFSTKGITEIKPGSYEIKSISLTYDKKGNSHYIINF